MNKYLAIITGWIISCLPSLLVAVFYWLIEPETFWQRIVLIVPGTIVQLLAWVVAVAWTLACLED